MKAKTNTNKKSSARKKLIPAAGSLMISAAMLSTSTYAWFTMSREVEVNNIKLTATTPEDIQIAIGRIGSNATTPSTAETYTLAGSTGVLVNTAGVVTAPREEGTDNDELDWSNSADISKYYQFGKLIPASSTDGENVFFTPDANGVGRTVKSDAGYYQAAAATTAYQVNAANTAFGTGTGFTGDAAKATAYVDNTSGGNDATWTTPYAKSTSWTETNDDGYYIDIPVWLRTSSSETTNIYVTGYITKGANTTDDDADDVLYQSVRVAVLSADGSANGGIINLHDGTSYPTNKTAYNATTNAGGIQTILDSDNYNNRPTAGSHSGINALNATTPGYDAITQNDGATSLGVLDAGDGAGYGDSTQFWIRIWIEGEDADCWNENAGQDWNISLKFMKTALTDAT